MKPVDPMGFVMKDCFSQRFNKFSKGLHRPNPGNLAVMRVHEMDGPRKGG